MALYYLFNVIVVGYDTGAKFRAPGHPED